MLGEVASESGDLSVSRIEDILLSVEFSIQINTSISGAYIILRYLTAFWDEKQSTLAG